VYSWYRYFGDARAPGPARALGALSLQASSVAITPVVVKGDAKGLLVLGDPAADINDDFAVLVAYSQLASAAFDRALMERQRAAEPRRRRSARAA
jgi:hypothetical protein